VETSGNDIERRVRAFARRFRTSRLSFFAVDPSPSTFFLSLVWGQRERGEEGQFENKKKAKKKTEMRARACVLREDSRRRVLEDDTSNARVDVFRARMCSFCLPSGVVRGGSLVGKKELSKETQTCVMEREKSY